MNCLISKGTFVMKKYFDVVRSYFKGNKERCLTLLVVLILIGSLFLTYNIYAFKIDFRMLSTRFYNIIGGFL